MSSTIYTNMSIFSTIVTSAPGVVVPSEYGFDKLFSWIEWFGFALECLMTMLFAFVTIAFKFWFFFTLICLVTMLIAVEALTIEFCFPIAPAFVLCMTYLATVITSGSLIPFFTLFGGFTFFLVSETNFTLLYMKILLILLIQLIHVCLRFHHPFIDLLFWD